MKIQSPPVGVEALLPTRVQARPQFSGQNNLNPLNAKDTVSIRFRGADKANTPPDSNLPPLSPAAEKLLDSLKEVRLAQSLKTTLLRAYLLLELSKNEAVISFLQKEPLGPGTSLDPKALSEGGLKKFLQDNIPQTPGISESRLAELLARNPEFAARHNGSTVSDEDLAELKKEFRQFAADQGQAEVTPLTLWHGIMLSDKTAQIGKHVADIPTILLTVYADLTDTQMESWQTASRKALAKSAAPTVDPNQSKQTAGESQRKIPTPDELKIIESALAEVPKIVVGQDEALSSVLDYIERSMINFSVSRNPHAPNSVQLFLGPTGVGKSFAAKTIAKAMGREIIQINMNEYNDGQSVTRLTGASPGYTGYDDGSSLVDRINAARKRAEEKGTLQPLILFDEIEKAHAEVFDTLMQVMEEGWLESGSGKKCILDGMDIIMTSNVAQKEINKAKAAGLSFEEISAITKAILKGVFRPEFLNRIGNSVVFDTLTKEDAAIILNNTLMEYQTVAKKNYDLDIQINDEVRQHLLAEGFKEPEMGARNLNREVEKILGDALYKKTKALIKEGQFKPGKYDVSLNNTKIQIEFTPA